MAYQTIERFAAVQFWGGINWPVAIAFSAERSRLKGPSRSKINKHKATRVTVENEVLRIQVPMNNKRTSVQAAQRMRQITTQAVGFANAGTLPLPTLDLGQVRVQRGARDPVHDYDEFAPRTLKLKNLCKEIVVPPRAIQDANMSFARRVARKHEKSPLLSIHSGPGVEYAEPQSVGGATELLQYEVSSSVHRPSPDNGHVLTSNPDRIRDLIHRRNRVASIGFGVVLRSGAEQKASSKLSATTLTGRICTEKSVTHDCKASYRDSMVFVHRVSSSAGMHACCRAKLKWLDRG